MKKQCVRAAFNTAYFYHRASATVPATNTIILYSTSMTAAEPSCDINTNAFGFIDLSASIMHVVVAHTSVLIHWSSASLIKRMRAGLLFIHAYFNKGDIISFLICICSLYLFFCRKETNKFMSLQLQQKYWNDLHIIWNNSHFSVHKIVKNIIIGGFV